MRRGLGEYDIESVDNEEAEEVTHFVGTSAKAIAMAEQNAESEELRAKASMSKDSFAVIPDGLASPLAKPASAAQSHSSAKRRVERRMSRRVSGVVVNKPGSVAGLVKRDLRRASAFNLQAGGGERKPSLGMGMGGWSSPSNSIVEGGEDSDDSDGDFGSGAGGAEMV